MDPEPGKYKFLANYVNFKIKIDIEIIKVK